MTTKVFIDAEFTGLVQNAELISIGLISECGKIFYAEFNDYRSSMIDDWIRENVISKLKYNGIWQILEETDTSVSYKSTCENIGRKLDEWFSQFDEVEIWSDCLAYDWVLFCQIFGGAFGIQKNIYYIPFDISTLFKIVGINPDINREEFARMTDNNQKHNALWDAKVIRECYNRALMHNL